MKDSSGRPDHQMLSTWREDPKSWTRLHRLLNHLDPFHVTADARPPVFPKSAPVPVLTQWSSNLYVLIHAAVPMVLHWLYSFATGRALGPWGALALYSLAFDFNSGREVRVLWNLAMKIGFLDGEKARDEVPNSSIGKTLASTQLVLLARTPIMIFLTYTPTANPLPSLWLPVELFIFTIVLDLYFYIYHRACHEIDFLWRYHRTHHMTKHPTPLLTGYSDVEQELLEMCLIPLLSYSTVKMLGLSLTFSDWWICISYIMFTEILGHSGIRAFALPPGPATFVLQYVGCELAIEDHDLHHRQGWKKSCNYGKQTRLWDRLFGTCGQRIELLNVDPSMKVDMPLF